VEGKSLLPVLEGGTRQGHNALYWYDPHIGAGAVRMRRWKLVSEGTDMPWEFYDMVEDRTETNDLADEQPDRVRSMAKNWYEWAARMGVVEKMPAAPSE
jgi:arylsulfatase